MAILAEIGLSPAPNINVELERCIEAALKMSIDISSGEISVCRGEAWQAVTESVWSCGYPMSWGLSCSHLFCTHCHPSVPFAAFLGYERWHLEPRRHEFLGFAFKIHDELDISIGALMPNDDDEASDSENDKGKQREEDSVEEADV